MFSKNYLFFLSFKQVLSLEEILSEGAIGGQNGSADDKASTTRLVKSQVCKKYHITLLSDSTV